MTLTLHVPYEDIRELDDNLELHGLPEGHTYPHEPRYPTKGNMKNKEAVSARVDIEKKHDPWARLGCLQRREGLDELRERHLKAWHQSAESQ